MKNHDLHVFLGDRAINPQGPAPKSGYLRETDWIIPPLKQLSMPLTLKWGPFTIFRALVYGGPYREAPASLGGVKVVGVKMAIEIDRECDINVPTKDFETPPPVIFRFGLEKAVQALLEDKPIYVGCMGGIGRTGLFMAGLAKIFGLGTPHPGDKHHPPTDGSVGYVRTHYRLNALETAEQRKMIQDMHFDEMTHRLKKAAFRRWVRRGFKA